MADDDPLLCAVCMEPMTARESPSQLPCAHFCCVTCLKKLYPLNGTGGLKCPVCQRNYANWALLEMKEAPGGVVMAEKN